MDKIKVVKYIKWDDLLTPYRPCQGHPDTRFIYNHVIFGL